MSGLEFFKAAFSSGQMVFVRVRVVPGAGPRTFAFVEHVWRRDGVEVAHHYAPVGDEHGWQTWSRHRVEAGDYTVDVMTPDGRRLAAKSFTVL